MSRIYDRLLAVISYTRSETSTPDTLFFESTLKPCNMRQLDEDNFTCKVAVGGMELTLNLTAQDELLESGSLLSQDKAQVILPINRLEIPIWTAVFDLGNHLAVYVPIRASLERPAYTHRLNLNPERKNSVILAGPATSPSSWGSIQLSESAQIRGKRHHTVLIDRPASIPPLLPQYVPQSLAA